MELFRLDRFNRIFKKNGVIDSYYHLLFTNNELKLTGLNQKDQNQFKKHLEKQLLNLNILFKKCSHRKEAFVKAV